MAYRIAGTYVAACDCAGLCPCPVDGQPTGEGGECRGALVFGIKDGSLDDVDLGGVNFALYNWNPSVAPVNIAFIQPTTFSGSQFPASKQGHAFVSESGPTYGTGPQTLGKNISEFVLSSTGILVSGPTPLIEYNGSGKATCAGLAAGPDGLYFTDLYKDLNYSSPTDPGANLLRLRYRAPADCNNNGTPDWCDIAMQTSRDRNGNGIPDECDCTADYNGDGFVDGIDSDLFENDFESPDPVQQMRADINGDGFVDGIDYDMFNNDFENPCP